MKNLLIIIVAIVVIGAGAAYYFSSRTTSQEKQQMEEKKMMGSPPPASGDTMMKKEGETTMMKKDKDSSMMEYSGALLAGKSAPLLDFTKADFDAALTSNKLVVLYYYANWCPECRVEFPEAQAAFNELTSDQVIGFRVNYNDSDTDADEVALAREYGIGYQHTKVFLKDGQQLLKSLESWDKDRYLSEIAAALK